MFSRIPPVVSPGAALIFAAFALCGSSAASAQRSDLNLELHANENVNAANMGLPVYPHARPTSDAKNDSAVDLGMSFGSFHFRLMVSKYVTDDSPEQVLSFYRKPLSRYGDVLECEHGEPVGAIRTTRSGLTCADSHDQKSHLHANESSRRELRSGTPALYRIVAIDSSSTSATHFVLLLLDVPKESGTH